MVWELDTFWMLTAVASVSILAFMLAMFINAVTGPQIFGPVGNAVIMTAGFFLGLALANHFGYRFNDLTVMAMAGMGSAFAGLLGFGVLKGLLSRL